MTFWQTVGVASFVASCGLTSLIVSARIVLPTIVKDFKKS